MRARLSGDQPNAQTLCAARRPTRTRQEVTTANHFGRADSASFLEFPQLRSVRATPAANAR